MTSSITIAVLPILGRITRNNCFSFYRETFGSFLSRYSESGIQGEVAFIKEKSEALLGRRDTPTFHVCPACPLGAVLQRRWHFVSRGLSDGDSRVLVVMAMGRGDLASGGERPGVPLNIPGHTGSSAGAVHPVHSTEVESPALAEGHRPPPALKTWSLSVRGNNFLPASFLRNTFFWVLALCDTCPSLTSAPPPTPRSPRCQGMDSSAGTG